jgi:hypothetical protein
VNVNEDILSSLERKCDQPKPDRIDRSFDRVVSQAEFRLKEDGVKRVSQDSVSVGTPEFEAGSACEQAETEKVAYSFEDPLELAQILMPSVKFHGWQDKLSREVAAARPTQFSPFKLCLTAANGSGKDAFFITPFVVWFMTTRKDALVVITSSSGTQLTAQTENYIYRMCESFNKFVQREAFKIIKRHIRCTDTGSECRMFATDEAGKAEGYHPLEPGAEMAIIVNEAKSVSEDIFDALMRCTGFNYWFEISTPGEAAGHFYTSNIDSEKLGYKKVHITSYDCPHKNPAEIEQDKLRWGEHSAAFRSKHLALFTQLDGQFVVSRLALDRCRKTCTSHIGAAWPLRVGIDVALSNGGDETYVVITQGNKLMAALSLYEEDITALAHRIAEFLSKNGVPFHSDHIFIDDGGVGRALWPLLRDKGWTNINRVLNQFAAFNKVEFANRGAEIWFNCARLIEENLLLLPDDDLLLEQISNRKYRRSTIGGKISLESKREMKAEGRKSPDRADAYFLAYHGLTIEAFHEALKKGDAREVKSSKGFSALTSRQMSGSKTSNRIIGFSSAEPEVNIDDEIAVLLGKSKREAAPTNFTSTIGRLVKHAMSYGNSR